MTPWARLSAKYLQLYGHTSYRSKRGKEEPGGRSDRFFSAVVTIIAKRRSDLALAFKRRNKSPKGHPRLKSAAAEPSGARVTKSGDDAPVEIIIKISHWNNLTNVNRPAAIEDRYNGTIVGFFVLDLRAVCPQVH